MLLGIKYAHVVRVPQGLLSPSRSARSGAAASTPSPARSGMQLGAAPAALPPPAAQQQQQQLAPGERAGARAALTPIPEGTPTRHSAQRAAAGAGVPPDNHAAAAEVELEEGDASEQLADGVEGHMQGVLLPRMPSDRSAGTAMGGRSASQGGSVGGSAAGGSVGGWLGAAGACAVTPQSKAREPGTGGQQQRTPSSAAARAGQGEGPDGADPRLARLHNLLSPAALQVRASGIGRAVRHELAVAFTDHLSDAIIT